MRSENFMTWKEIKKDVETKFDKKFLKWHEHNENRIYVDIDPKDLRDERILIKKAPPYLMDVEGAAQTYVF